MGHEDIDYCMRLKVSVALCLLPMSTAKAALADNELSVVPPEQPLKCKAFYVDVPSAGNPLANMMLRSVVGKAAWMDQLKKIMSLGGEPPMTRLVVAGQREAVVRTAVQAALDTFEEGGLQNLTLTVVRELPKMQSLQVHAERLGITFHMLRSDGLAVAATSRANVHLRWGGCEWGLPPGVRQQQAINQYDGSYTDPTGSTGAETAKLSREKVYGIQRCMMGKECRYTGNCEGEVSSKFPACQRPSGSALDH